MVYDDLGIQCRAKVRLSMITMTTPYCNKATLKQLLAVFKVVQFNPNFLLCAFISVSMIFLWCILQNVIQRKLAVLI